MMFRKFLLPMVLVLALSLPVAGAENPLSKLTEGENLEGICVMARDAKAAFFYARCCPLTWTQGDPIPWHG